MVALKGDKEIGEKINIIIAKLAEANDLKGVIDVADFNEEEKLGTGKEMVDRLSNLIAIFNRPELNFRNNRAEGDDNRALGGLNESCAAVASMVLHQLEQLNRKVGCATLILHHANKSSVLNGNSTAQGIRGSSAWSDNARWQANMAVMSEAELANYEVDHDSRKSWVKLIAVEPASTAAQSIFGKHLKRRAFLNASRFG